MMVRSYGILLLLLLAFAGLLVAQPSVAWTEPQVNRNAVGFGFKAAGFVPWQDARRMALWRSGAVVKEGASLAWLQTVTQRLLAVWPDSLPKPETVILKDDAPLGGHSPAGLVYINAGLLANARTEWEIAYLWAFHAAQIQLGTPEVLPMALPLPQLLESGELEHSYEDWTGNAVASSSQLIQADSMAMAWLRLAWPDEDLPAMAAICRQTRPDQQWIPYSQLCLHVSAETVSVAFPDGKGWQPKGYAQTDGWIPPLGGADVEDVSAGLPEAVRLECAQWTLEALLLKGKLAEAFELSYRLGQQFPTSISSILLTRVFVAFAAWRASDTSPIPAEGISVDLHRLIQSNWPKDWACLGILAAWEQMAGENGDDPYWEQVLAMLMGSLRQHGVTYQAVFSPQTPMDIAEPAYRVFDPIRDQPLFREMMLTFLEQEEDQHYVTQAPESKLWKNSENPRFKGADRLPEGKVLVMPPFWLRVIGDKHGFYGWVPDHSHYAKRVKDLEKVILAADLKALVAGDGQQDWVFWVHGAYRWKNAMGLDLPYPFCGELEAELSRQGCNAWIEIGSYTVSTKPEGNGTWFAGTLLFSASVPGLIPFVMAETFSYAQQTYFYSEYWQPPHLEKSFEGLMYVEEKDRDETLRAREYDLLKQIQRRKEVER